MMMHPAPSPSTTRSKASSTKRARENSTSEHEYECDTTVRKNNHRLVEQRRRDKMNSLIDELSSLLPSQFLNAQPSRTRPNILTAAISYLEAAQKVLTALDVPASIPNHSSALNGNGSTVTGSGTIPTFPTSNFMLLPEGAAFSRKPELSVAHSRLSTDSSTPGLSMPTRPDLSNICNPGISLNLNTQQAFHVGMFESSQPSGSSCLRQRSSKSKAKMVSSSFRDPSSLLARSTISPIGNLHATGPLTSSPSFVSFPTNLSATHGDGHFLQTQIGQFATCANDNTSLNSICARGEDVRSSAQPLPTGEFSSEHVHSDPNLHLESLSMGGCGVAAAAAALASAFENSQQVDHQSPSPNDGQSENCLSDASQHSTYHNHHHVSVDELSMYS